MSGPRHGGRRRCATTNHIHTHKGNNMQAIHNFLQDEDGVTAIEYALMAALIATALIAAVTILGDGIKAGFTAVVNKMTVA